MCVNWFMVSSFAMRPRTILSLKRTVNHKRQKTRVQSLKKKGWFEDINKQDDPIFGPERPVLVFTPRNVKNMKGKGGAKCGKLEKRGIVCLCNSNYCFFLFKKKDFFFVRFFFLILCQVKKNTLLMLHLFFFLPTFFFFMPTFWCQLFCFFPKLFFQFSHFDPCFLRSRQTRYGQFFLSDYRFWLSW